MKKLFKKLFVVIAVIAIIVIIRIFVLPVGYNMYYSECGNKQEYNVNNIVFSSGIRDYHNIAFQPNREGFRAGAYWLKAYMNIPCDVTVNSYDTYLIYRNKTVLLSQTDVGQQLFFMENNYGAMRYESANNVSEIFYIPDSELKKIKGIKIVANVTISDGTDSVTETMEFEYKANYKGYSMFAGLLASV